jgi:hypothetical protein
MQSVKVHFGYVGPILVYPIGTEYQVTNATGTTEKFPSIVVKVNSEKDFICLLAFDKASN